MSFAVVDMKVKSSIVSEQAASFLKPWTDEAEVVTGRGGKPPASAVGRDSPGVRHALRWLATYCLMISRGAPPTVATK